MLTVDPALIARLEAVGGLLTGNVDERFGSVEVLTPYGLPYKYIWTTPTYGLQALVSEWEARTDLCPRPLSFTLLRDAAPAQPPKKRRRPSDPPP
jgi:hypothetical protein